MRSRRIIGGVIAVVVIGCVPLAAWLAHLTPPAPILTFLDREPAGMIDDSGAELCVVYFTVSNANLPSQPANKANTFYVKAASRVVEAKVGNHWSKLSEISGMDNSVCHLGAGQQFECLLLAPAGINTFRVWLKCARPARPFSLKATTESIALRLPLSVRSQISYKFWRWIGFPASGPSENWQEVCVELALPPT